MALGFLSPIGGAGWQFFTDSGLILSGGKIFTYLAGTTTPAATYTTSSLGTPNANPIILDGSGRPPNEIWLQQGITYKFILNDSNGNLLSESTFDNISGINDVSNTNTFSEWLSNNLVTTFISTTSFSVPGNQLTLFTVNRRILTQNSGGTVYGYISASSFGSGITTVTVVTDSGVLDSGLSSVSLGFTDPTHSSINPLLNVQVFTTSGTYTPTNGATKLIVKAIGGGGGGGGGAVTNSNQSACGQGGGAGAYAEVYISSKITTQVVTIGGGGAGGIGAGSNGASGGTTTFGSIITCVGGTPGASAGATSTPQLYGIPIASAAPTTTATGIILAAGVGGYSGITMAVGDVASGSGASSVFGAGGNAVTSNSAGGTGIGFGTGGSGAACTATGGPNNGGAGAGGCIVVYEYV